MSINNIKIEKSEYNVKPQKLSRCLEWLEKQNIKMESNTLNLYNYIEDVTEMNITDNLMPVKDEVTTIPTGVNEPALRPKLVPLNRLRFDNLSLECEWQNCQERFENYDLFQEHIEGHIANVHRIEKDDGVKFACLWDVCGHKSPDVDEIIRHINYHAYHAKLLAIGFNGRSTLKLPRCKKDSTKRNRLPDLPCDHSCMWTGCIMKFNSVQAFFTHVEGHVLETKPESFMCSWAGCGATFIKRAFLKVHMRTHTNERVIACYHCGTHFNANRKLLDHLRRQNVSKDSPYVCSMCGIKCATAYLLSEHTRQHVSAYVCALCDMSAPSGAALAIHMRYRHLSPATARPYACPHCEYRAVRKYDLGKHIPIHKKKMQAPSEAESDCDRSDKTELDSDAEVKKKKKVAKKYACHLCPEKTMKIYSKGAKLTSHLVKQHGAQWPFGHSRFRYQKSEDGMYRLTTTRYEVLEVSKKIVDRDRSPKAFPTNKYEFELIQTAEPTKSTPRKYEIKIKNHSVKEESDEFQDSIEITMCDVDEQGNVIKTEVIKNVVFQ